MVAAAFAVLQVSVAIAGRFARSLMTPWGLIGYIIAGVVGSWLRGVLSCKLHRGHCQSDRPDCSAASGAICRHFCIPGWFSSA
jgi:uncharacterized membrane protein YeaQ/YmgE (transglycosylase-associated protein family)